ncbi:MAG: hypothetical protein OIF50_01960 [Flavobacteriaceae bacterium]|nr:hypothetical protein [Flavobacteriaceae bacterium]
MKPRSHINWNAREMNLYHTDNNYRKNYSYASGYRYQRTTMHEFGHTIGNVIRNSQDIFYGDEYKRSIAWYGDWSSIMSRGMEIRDRHLDYIIDTLRMNITGTFWRVE